MVSEWAHGFTHYLAVAAAKLGDRQSGACCAMGDVSYAIVARGRESPRSQTLLRLEFRPDLHFVSLNLVGLSTKAVSSVKRNSFSLDFDQALRAVAAVADSRKGSGSLKLDSPILSASHVSLVSGLSSKAQ